MENNIGRILFDDELAAALESPNTRCIDKDFSVPTKLQSHENADTGSSFSSDPIKLQANKMTDTWSSLFQKRTDRSRDLQRHARPSTDPSHHIVFDDHDSSTAVQNWGNALVGYFIGKSLPLPEIKSCLSRAWRVKDLEIIPMAEGFMLFKFHSYDSGQQILDDGPWFV